MNNRKRHFSHKSGQNPVTKEILDNRDIVHIIETQERKKILSHLQTLAIKSQQISSPPHLILKTLSNPLQYAGSIFFGIFIGVCSLVFSFLLFVYLMHLEL